MHRIIAGYDGSECGLAALRWAMDEAAARAGSVRVVTVVEPRLVRSLTSASVWEPPPASDLLEAAQLAEEALGKVAADLPNPPGAEVSALIGHAGPTLVRAASDADLLVVGSHGHGPIQGLLLGSVSLFAVHHSHCPVTVVRSASVGVDPDN